MKAEDFKIAGKRILLSPENKPLERCKKCNNLFYEFQRPLHELDECIGTWDDSWIDLGPIAD